MSEHSEQLPPSEKPEVHTPTAEQLKEGYYLEPDETVAFDIPASGRRARFSQDIGNGVEVVGQPVAVLRFGGEKTHATGIVINILDGEEPHNMLVVHSPGTERTFTAGLKKGELWGIGRSFEGQDMLPDTVSRSHCAVGLDEEGKFVVENNQPTNFTAVQRIE